MTPRRPLLWTAVVISHVTLFGLLNIIAVDERPTLGLVKFQPQALVVKGRRSLTRESGFHLFSPSKLIDVTSTFNSYMSFGLASSAVPRTTVRTRYTWVTTLTQCALATEVAVYICRISASITVIIDAVPT